MSHKAMVGKILNKEVILGFGFRDRAKLLNTSMMSASPWLRLEPRVSHSYKSGNYVIFEEFIILYEYYNLHIITHDRVSLPYF
jgi:hypothetical protein